jgi:glycosyltransferase involved in cell wall biosynthesis/Flp pilus assembly protein TadD
LIGRKAQLGTLKHMSKAGKKSKDKARDGAQAVQSAAAAAQSARSRASVPDWAGSPADVDDLRPEELAARFGTIKEPLRLPHPPGTLSIAMIVKNEALNIKDAVESFRPIADEIVIFDTGSTDGTQAILDSLGVKWIQGEWRNDFAWARNQSIAAATCSWILWMDADDRIPADQIAHFRKLKTAPLDRAFGFQVINTQGGLPLGGRFMQLRMFPNHPVLRFRYTVHEQLFHSVAKLGLHCFYTETTILHTGYEDPELKKKKALRNLLLLEEDPQRVAREPSLAMAIGDSHFILGDFEKGIEAYRRTMEMPNCEAINRDIYRELPSCIGRGYQKLGRREEALPWFDRSIALQPEKHEAYFYKAECLMEMGRGPEAETLYSRLVTMPVSFSTTSNQFDIIQIYSNFYLAQFLFERRQIDKAAERLEHLNAKYPQVVEAWELLGKCRLAQGRPEAAAECWTVAINLNPRAKPELHSQRLALLKHLDRRQEFDASLPQARELFPARAFPEWRDLPGTPSMRTPSAPATPEAAAARPGLSLCMIVKNEKDNLPACLASVGDLAGEIIVVDTGSTDGTQDIARSFGAKLVQSEWHGDFSRARNQSLDAATGRWIIWLDADDRLLEEDKRAIRALAEADPDLQPKGYGLRVKNSRDGGLTGSVFNQVRVFPNRPDLRFRAPVHEQILPALEEARIPVEYVAARVLHTGYSDPEVAKAKQVRNKAILEAQVKEGKGITPVTYYTLATACADLGLHGEAVPWFLKAAELAAATGTDPHILAAAPAKMAASLASQKLYSQALELLAPALAGSAPGAEALLVKAQVEEALGRTDEARPWYERLLALSESGTFIPVDFQLLKIKALQFLGQYWYARGRQDLAVSLLKAGLAVKEGRDFGPSHLAEAYRTHGAA